MNRSIFIVEDDEDIGNNLKEILEYEGYEVDVAREGAQALKELKQRVPKPGLIILDLMMPGMDGFQFREHQKLDAELALIPVVVMTADGRVEEKKARVGANDFLRKPVDIETVLDVAKKYCG